jgi:hypothetical protein
MTMRLVTSRIWFWQIASARRAGWFVRAPWSFRPVIAQFFKLGAVSRGPANCVDGSGLPLGSSLRGNIVGNGEPRGLLKRAFHDCFVALVVAIDFEKLAKSLVSEDMQPVENGSRKLSLNQLLQLRGHAPIVHPNTLERLANQALLKARIADIQARRSASRESGSAA